MKPYRPSNGTEGEWFIHTFCRNCIRGKYEHTGNINDNPCEIITAGYFCDIDDPLYPKEWIYGDNGKPWCTAWEKWDWGRDDGDGLNEPPVIPPDDNNPNQLVLPFIFEYLNIKHHERENSTSNCLVERSSSNY